MAAPGSRSSALRWWSSCAAAGLALGLINSLSNVFGSPYGGHRISASGVPALQILAAALGTPWAWALVAFWVGWFARTLHRAVLGALLALWAATLAYYLTDWLGAQVDRFEWASLLVWALVSLPTAACFGTSGRLGANRAWWSLLPAAAAPGVVLLFGFEETGSLDIQPWPAIVGWAVAALMFVLVLVPWLLPNRVADSDVPGRSLRLP